MADLALTNANGAPERVDARRSTRVFQAIPLSISGTNELGNPFLEISSAVAVNCHGCLYRSRYHNRPGAWVTLHMAATGKAQPVRAQIRFVRLPMSPKDLYQVGVELESPANVWGIQTPPEDWTSFARSFAAAPAIEKCSGLRVVPEGETPRPDASANGAAAPEIAVMPPAGKPVRVVVSSEQLLQRLEGKLQQAAEKAVDSAMSVRFNAAVNQAAKAIDEFSQSSVRKVQTQYEQYSEQMVTSSREQLLSRVQADVSAAEERLERRVEALLARAEEIARRLEGSLAAAEPAAKRLEASVAAVEPALQKAAVRAQDEFAARAGEIASRTETQLTGQSARLGESQIARLSEQAQSTVEAAAKQLQAKTDESRSQVISAAGTALAELHIAAKSEIDRAVGESRQKVEASLESLCNDTTHGWEARLRAGQDELAATSAREAQEFRKRLQAIMNSSMVAATSAVSEHAKALLDALAKDTEQSPAPEAERQAS